MNNISIEKVLEKIEAADCTAFEKAKEHLLNLAKPPGSLGRLEEIAARLCAINGNLSPSIEKRCVIVFASDNGVVSEGVSSAPQAVTAVQTLNILNGTTGVGVIAKRFNADLLVVDVGVNADISHPLLIDRKIRKSTDNMAVSWAMSRKDAEKAVLVGVELAVEAKKKGYAAIGVGEMGIGNTTTASAVLAALLGMAGDDIATITGRGAGLQDDAYLHKISVINTALNLHKPDKEDPVDVLAKVGGLDICAMTGAFLGAAYCRVPAVIDGFISAVAALCAVRINPLVGDYLFASHSSYERGYALAAKELSLSPCLNLEMRLGEGSGCPLMFCVMDASIAVLADMATFGEAQIDEGYTANIKKIEF